VSHNCRYKDKWQSGERIVTAGMVPRSLWALYGFKAARENWDQKPVSHSKTLEVTCSRGRVWGGSHGWSQMRGEYKSSWSNSGWKEDGWSAAPQDVEDGSETSWRNSSQREEWEPAGATPGPVYLAPGSDSSRVRVSPEPPGPRPTDGFPSATPGRQARASVVLVGGGGRPAEYPPLSAEPADYDYLVEGATGEARRSARKLIKEQLKVGLKPSMDPDERALRKFALQVHDIKGDVPIDDLRRIAGYSRTVYVCNIGETGTCTTTSGLSVETTSEVDEAGQAMRRVKARYDAEVDCLMTEDEFQANTEAVSRQLHLQILGAASSIGTELSRSLSDLVGFGCRTPVRLGRGRGRRRQCRAEAECRGRRLKRSEGGRPALRWSACRAQAKGRDSGS